MVAIPCGFESHHRHQLVASDISLATSFFILLQSSSRAHSAAPRFQTEPAIAGLRFGIAASRRFYCAYENIGFNRPLHVGAKGALLRRFFIPTGQKTSSARSLLVVHSIIRTQSISQTGTGSPVPVWLVSTRKIVSHAWFSNLVKRHNSTTAFCTVHGW